MPYTIGGKWYNASPCGCSSDCSCGELCKVFLPGPFHAMVEVTLDGAILDPDAYRVDRVAAGYELVRQDGDCWPRCQNLAVPLTEDGSFGVTYEYGIPLDADAVAAHSEYTAELVKKCLPNCDCRLTDVDLETAAQGGFTGLPFVDGWVRSVNPAGLPQELVVMSPDSGWTNPRQQVWP
jgi:hypothetical protein